MRTIPAGVRKVMLAHVWEGPPTYVRPKVHRGSAAGANDGVDHEVAGYDSSMAPVTRCGLHIRRHTVLTVRRSRRPVCARCASAEQ